MIKEKVSIDIFKKRLRSTQERNKNFITLF